MTSITELKTWWEIPYVAHFCSLFQDVFQLPQFDIEDLEEGLIVDGGEERHDLVVELIITLLRGCFPKKEITLLNYERQLNKLIRNASWLEEKDILAEEGGWTKLTVLQKVNVLHTLCDLRLDAPDIENTLRGLETDNLRLEPLGEDSEGTKYWYFYGTRLYQEKFDGVKREEPKKGKKGKGKRQSAAIQPAEPIHGKFSVVCESMDDWEALSKRFSKSKIPKERLFSKCLVSDFLPEMPHLFEQKDKEKDKRVRGMIARRTSWRLEVRKVQELQEQQEARERQQAMQDRVLEQRRKREEKEKDRMRKARAHRAERRATRVFRQIRRENNVEGASGSSTDDDDPSGALDPDDYTAMFKILRDLRKLDDTEPFLSPVDEEEVPGYHEVISTPMDVSTMEARVEARKYESRDAFIGDMDLIVKNCVKFNGAGNSYSSMAKRMRSAFSRLLERHWDVDDSSEDDWCRTEEGKSSRRPPQRRFVIHSDDSTEVSNEGSDADTDLGDVGSDEETASQSTNSDDESDSEAGEDYDSERSWASDAPVRSAPMARKTSRPQRQASCRAIAALAQTCRQELDDDETEEDEEEEAPPAKRRNVILSDDDEDAPSADDDGHAPAEAPLARAAPPRGPALQPAEQVLHPTVLAQVGERRPPRTSADGASLTSPLAAPPRATGEAESSPLSLQVHVPMQPEVVKPVEVPRPEPLRDMADPFRAVPTRLDAPQPFWEQTHLAPVRMPMHGPSPMGMQAPPPEPAPPLPWRMAHLEAPMARETAAIPRPSYVPARPPPPVPSAPSFFPQYGSGALSRLQSMTEALPGGEQRHAPMGAYFPQQQQAHPQLQQHLQQQQHPQQPQHQQPQPQQAQPFWGASQPYWQAQYPAPQYGPPPGYFAPNYGMPAAGTNEQPRHPLVDSKVYQQL